MTDTSHFISELRNAAVNKRRAAATLLGKSGNLSAIGPLVEALSDPHPGVRSDIVQALGRLRDSSAIPGLITSLEDTDPRVRAAAIDAVGKIKDRDAVDPLIRCLIDKEVIIRIGAAEVLGKLGDRRATGPLTALENDPSFEVREAVGMALMRIKIKSDAVKKLCRAPIILCFL